MDGARLWEAMNGIGKDLQQIARGFDSVYVSFDKGIGGLGGAMLLGEANFIEQARLWTQRQGGNVYRRTPYLVSAAMQFDQRLAAMTVYYQRTLWLYEVLESFPSLRANPANPQCNMLHHSRPKQSAWFYLGQHSTLLAVRCQTHKPDFHSGKSLWCRDIPSPHT